MRTFYHIGIYDFKVLGTRGEHLGAAKAALRIAGGRVRGGEPYRKLHKTE